MEEYRIALQSFGTGATGEGQRILADRHWPRGHKREAPGLDGWHPEVAPPASLQRDRHRGNMDQPTFDRLYRAALRHNADALIPLMRLARRGPLTLLTASGDPDHSHLPVLRQVILAKLAEEDRQADDSEPSSPVCYEPRR